MFARKLQHPRQNTRKKGKFIWEQAVSHRFLHVVLDRIDIQTQFKGSSREIEQQVKQYDAQTLNELSNVNARLKKSVVFF